MPSISWVDQCRAEAPVVQLDHRWVVTDDQEQRYEYAELVGPVQGHRLVFSRLVEQQHELGVFVGTGFFACALASPEVSLEHRGGDEFVFSRLVAEWRKERGATSSTSDIVLCYAYQAIIGMGQKAVPIILAQLESEGDNPDQWFWALQALTRANPVVEEDEGNYRKMARAWLNWAARNGYAW